VRAYDERTQLATLHVALLAHARHPPPGLADACAAHLSLKRGAVLAAAACWAADAARYRAVHGAEGLQRDFAERLAAVTGAPPAPVRSRIYFVVEACTLRASPVPASCHAAAVARALL